MEDVIEVAKSGRASCRTCKKKIEKGALRFGEATANQFDPDGGMTLRWHHLECAARSLGAKVRPALDAYDGELANRAELEQLMASSKGGERGLPHAELAPTGRSRCLECQEPIEKGTWRIAIEREIDTGMFTRTGAGYLHPACAEKHSGNLWDAVRENSELGDAEWEELRRAAG